MCDKSIIQFHLDRFLHRFYYILSKFYLTSYSGGSIFDHYCKFLLLDSTECLLINSLPVKEKFQFFLSFIVVFYYVAIIFDLINYYPDIIRFIAGDLALFFSDQTSTIPKILCIMLAFTIASVTFIVYSSMNTNRSLAFRTIILYLYDDETAIETNEKTVDKFRRKWPNSVYSNVTIMFLDYINKKIPIRVAEQKQSIDRFYGYNAVFYRKNRFFVVKSFFFFFWLNFNHIYSWL